MLGTSTRTSGSDVLINLGLNPLRWLREVESPQFGVLSARAPPSPRCTALTAASRENPGAAPNFGTRVLHEYPESSGEICTLPVPSKFRWGKIRLK